MTDTNTLTDPPVPAVRETVLRQTLAISAVAVPLVAAVIALQVHLSHGLNVRTVVLCLYTLVFPGLWLLRSRISSHWCGGLYLVFLVATSFIVLVRGGLTVAPSLLQLLVLIMAGLFFGRRGVYTALAANLISVAVAGLLVLQGLVPPVNESLWNPTITENWLRGSIILTLFGGAAAIAVTYVVARLERETSRLQDSLAREQAQRAALEEAERERLAAITALAEARRVEALARLAGGVAHDFNNYLTAIIGMAENAEYDPDLPEGSRNSVITIKETALNAADMTRGLLTLGRNSPLRPSLVSAASVLTGLSGSLVRLLPEDIVFRVAETTEALVKVDQTQFDRALINLVVNARDAIDQNGEISIGCRAERGKVRFWVSDNGRGMADEVLEHAFEPYFTTRPAGGSVGLGMALVRSIVEEAGGEVQLQSQLGEGTTVTLTLPQAEGELQSDSPEPEIELAFTLDSQRTILLVEDHPDVLASTTDTLRRAGFEVIGATGGDEALAIIRDEQRHFDLLCIDGVIPGVSSAEVIRWVQDEGPDVPIVVCTGYVEEELVLRGISTGELALVSKPYLGGELVGCVKTQLGLG